MPCQPRGRWSKRQSPSRPGHSCHSSCTTSYVHLPISSPPFPASCPDRYSILKREGHTINPPQNWVQSRASCPSRSLLTGEGIPRGGEMGIQRLGRDSKTEKVCGSFIRFPWDQDRTNHEHVKPSKLRTEKVI